MRPKAFLYIFTAEALVNVVTGCLAFFVPASFLRQFLPTGTVTPTPAVALEVVRWFGVLLFVLAYLWGRTAFFSRDNLVALRIVIEGLLLGDLIQLVATFLMFRSVGWSWTLGLTFLALLPLSPAAGFSGWGIAGASLAAVSLI